MKSPKLAIIILALVARDLPSARKPFERESGKSKLESKKPGKKNARSHQP
jgi:hypothetical protein